MVNMLNCKERVFKLSLYINVNYLDIISTRYREHLY